MNDARWEKIKQVFSAALERPAAERSAFVEAACAGDAELKREVEGLLAKRTVGGAGERLVRTGGAGEALEAAAAVPPTVTDQRLLEGPGTRIGPYKLLELIGEGGFGSVFMAEQESPVRRRVALKIIKPGMDSRMVAARFEAERQALALMEHPHIARVFDGGVTSAAVGARPYFVMEYVKGDPINAFADAHKLTLKDRLTLFIQVCEAVQHAHTKGIIHRDLKPSNVLVSMVDGRPFAKVIDFGIAKATGQRLTDKTLFTEHRQLIGTPEYMSPEQAEGSPDIDTRTDVYGLGVLLYQLLTGLTPFDSARLRSAAFAEMQRIIKEEDPPKPSLRLERRLGTPSLREGSALATGPLVPSTSAHREATLLHHSKPIKGELDWIVMKALDKDRARRYESASQLAADVQRHLNGEAVVAAPAGVGYRLRKFVRRNKGPVLGTSIVMLALLAGGSIATWQWNRANHALLSVSRINAKLIAQRDTAEAGVGKMMGIILDPEKKTHGPLISYDMEGNRQGEDDPLGYAIGAGIQMAESLREERDELESANVKLHYSLEAAEEHRRTLDRRLCLMMIEYSDKMAFSSMEGVLDIPHLVAKGIYLYRLQRFDEALQVFASCGEFKYTVKGFGTLPQSDPDFSQYPTEKFDTDFDLLRYTAMSQAWLGQGDVARNTLETLRAYCKLREESADEGWKSFLNAGFAEAAEVVNASPQLHSLFKERYKVIPTARREWVVRSVKALTVSSDYKAKISDQLDAGVVRIDASTRAFHAKIAYDAAWSVLVHPDSSLEAVRAAGQAANEADAITPEQFGMISLRGFAAFRAGRNEDAASLLLQAQTMANSNQYGLISYAISFGHDSTACVANLALLAMSQEKLKQHTKALATLSQLRILMANPAGAEGWMKDVVRSADNLSSVTSSDAKALLVEADSLINPPSAPPKP